MGSCYTLLLFVVGVDVPERVMADRCGVLSDKVPTTKKLLLHAIKKAIAGVITDIMA